MSGSRRAFCLGHLPWPLPPVVAQVGLRAQAQAMQAVGHHLLLGHWCQVWLVLPHWAGIIMPQLILQRPSLSPLNFPLASSSGLNQGLFPMFRHPGSLSFGAGPQQVPGQPKWPWFLVGSPWKQCDCSGGHLTHNRDGRILSSRSDQALRRVTGLPWGHEWNGQWAPAPKSLGSKTGFSEITAG